MHSVVTRYPLSLYTKGLMPRELPLSHCDNKQKNTHIATGVCVCVSGAMTVVCSPVHTQRQRLWEEADVLVGGQATTLPVCLEDARTLINFNTACMSTRYLFIQLSMPCLQRPHNGRGSAGNMLLSGWV